MTRNIQYIYLDNSNTRIAIAPEGYEQIKQTIERYRVCCHCELFFTHENPQVSLNWCKECFVRSGKGKGYALTYIGGVSPKPTQYNGIEYAFIAPDGYIYITGSEQEITHDMAYYNKNIRQTLTHWKFPALPEFYEVQGEQTQLHETNMHVYGDVRRDRILVVVYTETHPYSSSMPDIHLLFIVRKGSELAQEFNRRKGEGRKAWLAAKARVEATKDEKGDYHINGHTRSWVDESDYRSALVTLLNEQEELNKLEQRQAAAAQPIDPNLQPGDTIQLSLTDFEEARLRQLKEEHQQ